MLGVQYSSVELVKADGCPNKATLKGQFFLTVFPKVHPHGRMLGLCKLIGHCGPGLYENCRNTQT